MLNRLSTKKPDFITEIYNDKEDSIITENELDDTRSEITNLLDAGIEEIKEEFETMKDEEDKILEDRKKELLDKFKEENPKLFDIKWDELFGKKKLKEFNRIIRIKESWIRLRNIKKYEIKREGLMNYKGSIEKPMQPIFKNWFELVDFLEKTKEKGDKKVKKLKKIMSECLKETDEYKEAKEIIDNFEEFKDDIEDLFVRESEKLEEIKEIFENVFKKASEKLEGY